MTSPIKSIKPLGFPWVTQDPFLFCVHHEDFYPKGNDELGPAASLNGRNLGNDFVIKDGWRMYHGETIPGFPAHPHRGFETVTICTKGLIDHSDSLGAAGRFGNGDVQWMTAGKGVQHCEMFPLLSKEHENPLELFQIWLNLPREKKLAPPYFTMLWNENIPVLTVRDDQQRNTNIKLVAGTWGTEHAASPAPDSWAADPQNEVAIMTFEIEANATLTIPGASVGVNRSLYYYKGKSVQIGDKKLNAHQAVELYADAAVTIVNGDETSYVLMLQGKPIKEPVVQYGPFVMNSQAEIQQAFMEFQQTQFGGWPWSRYDHVHPRERGRFARYPDGREEER